MGRVNQHLTGRYQIDAEKATVAVNLIQNKKRVRQFTVAGKITAVDDLAARIVAETEKQIGLPAPAANSGQAGK